MGSSAFQKTTKKRRRRKKDSGEDRRESSCTLQMEDPSLAFAVTLPMYKDSFHNPDKVSIDLEASSSQAQGRQRGDGKNDAHCDCKSTIQDMAMAWRREKEQQCMLLQRIEECIAEKEHSLNEIERCIQIKERCILDMSLELEKLKEWIDGRRYQMVREAFFTQCAKAPEETVSTERDEKRTEDVLWNRYVRSKRSCFNAEDTLQSSLSSFQIARQELADFFTLVRPPVPCQ